MFFKRIVHREKFLAVWPALLGITLLCVFYWEVLIGKAGFLYRDMHLVHLPMRMNFIDRILNGEFPEWYPFDGLGSSYVGNVVTAIFHPSVWLHLFLPHIVALSFSVLLAHFFAGMGIYRLLRFWSCNQTASFIGATAYSGSGYLLSMGGNLPYLLAASAIPWAIWGFERSVKPRTESDVSGDLWRGLVPRASWSGLALCAAAMALLALSGDPQALYITSLFLLACALARPRAQWLSSLARLGIAGVTAYLASAIQLLPALYASGVRHGGDAALRAARSLSFNPLRILEFWSPGPWMTTKGQVPSELYSIQEFKSLWASSIFLGAVVLSLAFFAISQTGKRHKTRLLAALGTGALIVSLGCVTWTPGYALLQNILPGWSLLRYPEKNVVFVSLAVALLAGLGAQRLFASLQERKWLPLQAFRNRLLLFAAFNIILLAAFSTGSLREGILILAGAQLKAHAELREISPAITASLGSGSCFALVAWILTLPIRRLPYRVSEGLVCLLAILSLVAGTYGPMRMNLVQPEFFVEPPTAVKILREKMGSQELYEKLRLYSHYDPGEAVRRLKKSTPTLGTVNYYRQSVQNLSNGINSLFQIENADGYLPLTAQGRQFTAFKELPDLVYFHGFNVRAAQKLVDYPTDPEKTFELLFDDRAGDRIRLVQGIPVTSLEEAIALANTPNFNSVTTIPVETDEPDFPSQAPTNAQIEVLHYTPEKISVRASSETPSTLFIADAFADGWSATVNGEPAPIYPGLTAGRAIRVPVGTHDIQLIYKTPGLRGGMVLSAIGWIAIAVLAIQGRRKRIQ
ncbi:MAG: YfhO family protein [Myxococcales bacterium]|jgi:hypothetical protein|nr:YfhO family protein [Myxococcales bacterium]